MFMVSVFIDAMPLSGCDGRAQLVDGHRGRVEWGDDGRR